MGGAMETPRRTPEQDRCYFEAHRIADIIANRQGRDVDTEEFGRIYGATLHKRMREALEPINRAECRAAAMTIGPRLILAADGSFRPADDSIDREPFNKLRAPIIEAYTKGLV